MVLEHIAVGQPHVPIHNAERDAINALSTDYNTARPGSSFKLFFDEEDGWPPRPSDRTDISFDWTGGTILDTPTDALAGVDFWDRPKES